MKTTAYLFLVLAIFSLSGCQSGSSSHADGSENNSSPIDYSALEDLILKDDPAYAYEVGSVAYYVDANNGSDTNDGSENSPFATVLHALNQAQGGEVIYVANGNYGDLSFGATYYEGSKKVTPIEEVFTDSL